MDVPRQRLTVNSPIVLQCVEDHEPKSVSICAERSGNTWPLTGEIWKRVVILEHISYLRKHFSLGKPYYVQRVRICLFHSEEATWRVRMRTFSGKIPHNVLLETNHPSGCFDQSLPCRIMLYEGRNTVTDVWSDHINKFYRFNLRVINHHQPVTSQQVVQANIFLPAAEILVPWGKCHNLRLALHLLKQDLRGFF